MRWRKFFVAFSAVLFAVVAAHADSASLSYTGSLNTPESTFTLVFTVDGSGDQTINFQTWGFGGGVNAAGQTISPGGFDSFLGLFSGEGPSASWVDGSSDTQLDFPGYMGCPPAGTVGFANGDAVCGDVAMSETLAPGTYTLVLSDANYVPNADGGGTLGDGYSDLTGGAFQTCDENASSVWTCLTNGDFQTCTNILDPSTCGLITPDSNPSLDANWAFDITDTTGANLSVPAATPEPTTLLLLGTGLLAMGWMARRKVVLGEARIN